MESYDGFPTTQDVYKRQSMMCAGWDGCSVSNPGFPKDGKWNVRWEGLHPMP